MSEHCITDMYYLHNATSTKSSVFQAQYIFQHEIIMQIT